MKRLLKAQFYALRCHFWLPLALLAAGLVVGAVAGSFVRDTVLPKMAALRAVCDEAETHTAAKYWPFPTYGDLLFGV